MSDDEPSPFFWNTRRLQRAESYFEIGRSRDQLRQSISTGRHNTIQLGENTSVSYYGVNRYISLESAKEDDLSGPDFIEVDEDAEFTNTSAFSLFWMTFKRIALSISDQLSRSESSHGYQIDSEGNIDCDPQREELMNIVIDPSFRDSRIQQSRIIYGDVNYLIQKFRVAMNCGSLDIGLFSVEFPGFCAEAFHTTDIQTCIVSPECGSYVWVENGKASAIFLAKSSEDFLGNVMIWFRKILSDMTLADSVMIGHPFYWNATVRRRLSKALKYLKRLYVKLALKEKEQQKSGSTKRKRFINKVQDSPMGIELVRPDDISKVVINEKPSTSPSRSYTNYEKMNTMLDQLFQKWTEYQRNLQLSPDLSVESVSKTWREKNPQAAKGIPGHLESVTFLDFQTGNIQQPLSTGIPEIKSNLKRPEEVSPENSQALEPTLSENDICVHPVPPLELLCKEFYHDSNPISNQSSEESGIETAISAQDHESLVE